MNFNSEFNKVLITASEDNKIYIWNKVQKISDKIIKNNNYRCFEPFKSSKLVDSYCLNEAAFNDYMMKFSYFYNKILLKFVVLNTSEDGTIQVLINYEKLDDQVILDIKNKFK